MELFLKSVDNLVDLLINKAQEQPEQTIFKFLQEGEAETDSLNYQELDFKARVIAAKLQNMGMTGERALLLYPPGLEFITAFFGCLYAGVIGVPAYPPRANQNLVRLQAIVTSAGASMALTTASLLPSLEQRWASSLPLHWLATDSIKDNSASWKQILINQDSLAFLQYTSGSTGVPKGVMVSHGNLMHNSEYIRQAFELSPESVSVTWLPSFHDMGLIDGIIQPLYTGFLGVVMPPVAFIQQPIRWLQAISRYKATHCGGPNFGYDLCTKIKSEQLQGLDLSSWKSAYSGAEPVRRETLEKFTHTFADWGFQARFFYPCYGMAEATLMITGGAVNNEPVYCTVDSTALSQNQIIEVEDRNTQKPKHLVGCGHVWLDTKLVIVNPDTLTQCSSDQVGEIWVSGGSVAQGYWKQEEHTEQTFKAYLADSGSRPFLRTGDLGFVKNGELFVTGRLKDVVIIRGRNHYPQDIELTVERSNVSIRTSCSAAFSVEVAGEERLVIAVEVDRRFIRSHRQLERRQQQSIDGCEAVIASELDAPDTISVIRQAVSQHHDLQVYAVLLLKTGSIPKTSSGKIQRHACRNGFLNGTLDVVQQWIETVPVQSVIEETFHSTNVKPNWVVSLVAQKLQVNPQAINTQQPLSYYGLDSVQAVMLVADFEQYLERKLTPTLLYEYPTIDALVKYLDLVHTEASTTSIDNNQAPPLSVELNLNNEALLDPAICRITDFSEISKNKSILLTGATGFLGAYLLQQLCSEQKDVYCLVRASDTEIAKYRIQQNLELYGIWDESFSSRIIPVIGDLSKLKFGFANDEFENLASKIDTIYHSGALLNFVYPYCALKPVNVVGTQEILRLANQTKTKPVHYISSVSVFEGSAYANQVVTESDPLLHCEGIYMGYSQSKWVAEKLVMAACERGLPVCIYRPPLISGDSQTGAWYTSDFICRMIKGGIQMGYLPDLDFELDISPVDYVSKAIIYLSKQNHSNGQAFHLMNPSSIHWSELIDWMQSIGYSVQRISYNKWLEKLINTSATENQALYPLLPFFSQKWSSKQLTIPQLYQKLQAPNFSVDKTLNALAGSNITCPPVNSELLNIYFTYLINIGFLDKPRHFISPISSVS
ncbi:hypothetical protein DSM106972_025140 [Dulcicalothrix desertica PCC 7102]|uniref:Carrier domain-containing protein n=1 Tax=Dulcicalothrix desertica PCC 7102 TaxID=232991 RepID=A0A433VM96_9CYAN|nr:thioester reductase domain-containing protein [Dulcicalothrix desertica]RUT07253.1 hypothetical protein DSM106972_025140 [Dulcicalothrix desertica PCC 7102]TWH61753.1 thioester reductase-like protein [Dulcicalothrix desertica PCC 7102]